jgi:hypothetical protein
MNHGRDHDEREQKIGAGRTAETLEDDGADEDRSPHGGSEPAPTRQAAERERIRHEEERKRGRVAGGLGDNERDRRAPGVTREDLDEAARIADEAVGAKKE